MAEPATPVAFGQRAKPRDPRAAAPRPTVSRRREVSHASARSLLMTVLGEYVLPRDRPVWTSMLVDVLGVLDVEEKSARQALARSSAEGWLVSERVGRRVRWSLTPPGRRLLTEGAERIYEFGRAGLSWDGRWLMLIVSVPEAKRDLRHRLRTRLTWAGFGSPVAASGSARTRAGSARPSRSSPSWGSTRRPCRSPRRTARSGSRRAWSPARGTCPS